MMKPEININGVCVFLGDCREVLKGLPDTSIDSIVTDPPYELNFMSKKWDNTGIAYDVTVWLECLRVLKPGGHILAFGGSRTFHRLAVAIEDAGFEIRDTIAWISSKTFPKSLNIEKAMDKAGMNGSVAKGWGTGLKQVVEPVVLGRKPFEGSVAENFERWGVGALNIDATRINNLSEKEKNWTPQRQHANNPMQIGGAKPGDEVQMYKPAGRWPANVILDEASGAIVDEQSGYLHGSGNKSDSGHGEDVGYEATGYEVSYQGRAFRDYGSKGGGASRFFYVAKASKRDRNEGLEHLNTHPTVKPTQLMRYLIKLVTPPGGTVLDPFTGSGSTGKAALLDGFGFVGVELTGDYLPIIEGRLRWASEQVGDGDVTLF